MGDDGKPFLTDPGAFISSALKAVPAVRYAVGVGGIAAVVAVIAGFTIDYRIAVFGTVLLLGLMFVLLLFSRLTTVAGDKLLAPALFATWSFSVLTVLTATLLMSSFFLHQPMSLRQLFAEESVGRGSAAVASSPITAIAPISPTGAPPDEPALRHQYVRLFGALQVPILIQIQTAGGTACVTTHCSIPDGKVRWAGGEGPTNIQTGDIAKELGEYWSSQWPFKSAMPLGTALWTYFAQDGETGFKILSEADRVQAECLDRKLRPYQFNPAEGGHCAAFKAEQISDRAGFLFWVFRNSLDRPVTDLVLRFSVVPKGATGAAYLQMLQDPRAGSVLEQKLPEIAPGQSVILLTSVYDRKEDGFEARLLAESLIPRSVTYRDRGQLYTEEVRAPHRHDAVRAPLPFGWYQQ